MMKLRHLLPLGLIALGVSLLSGCLFVPTFETTIEGENVAKQVGDARSKRPVRAGATTRDEVLRRLGTPQYASPDASTIVYSWRVRSGVFVWPLCFRTVDRFGARGLQLRFDEAGMLSAFKLLKADGNWYTNDVYGSRHLPPGVQSVAAMPGWPHPAPATQPTVPATQPSPAPSAPSTP